MCTFSRHVTDTQIYNSKVLKYILNSFNIVTTLHVMSEYSP